MQIWAKRIIAAAATLLLTGCLWGPGKFTSDLTLKKDGSFTLDYKGELVIALPPDKATSVAWKDTMARCYQDGRSEALTGTSGDFRVTEEPPPEDGADIRPCTPAEITDLKSDYEAEAARKAAEDRKQNEEMAKAFGLPGLDDESNRAFAAKLMKYAGWRSVTYRGNGIFDVDYHFAGRATQDFIFPAIPDDDLIIPFIAIRRRADGSVFVTAPALTGGSGPLSQRAGQAATSAAPGSPPPSRAQGRFTIITDGEILTNNSEDGASSTPTGRSLHWDVGPSSSKIPEALIRVQ